MKKLVMLILMCCCFLLAGCDYGGAVLVQNSNGTIMEYYYVPYNELALANALQGDADGITMSRREILPAVKSAVDEMFVNLLNEYQNRVRANQTLGTEEKNALIEGVVITSNLPSNLFLVSGYYTEIRYEISFANSTCYAEFKNINPSLKEDRVVVTTSNLFTTTTKIIKDPIFDKISSSSVTTGQACVNLANSIMQEKLGPVLWEQVKQEMDFNKYSSKFEYTYVVPTARIHTNAHSVKKSSEGYYYHTWQVNLDNVVDGESVIKIEYWMVQANRAVWYVLSLVIAGIIVAITIIVAKQKEKADLKKFKIE